MAREVLGVAGAVIGGFVGGSRGAQIGFMVGSTIGGIIDPPNFDGPRLGDAAIQTSRDGIPIPIIWGTSHVVGNIIQINPIVETTKKVRTGKGGSTTTETTRTRTFAIGMCRSFDGPITGILRCWENNKLVYDARSGSSFQASENTAFESATTVYLGDETQLPDPDLEASTGVGNTPAYRGLPYIVWKNKDITNFGSSIPSYRFEVTVSGSSVLFGTTATQDGFSGDISHPHPFAGQAFPEFTKSSVFQASSAPVAGDSLRTTFGIDSPGKIGLSWTSNKIYLDAQIWSQPNGTANQTIAQASLLLGSVGGVTEFWTALHWYCVTISYSQPLNACTVSFVNLSRNEEVVVIAVISNNLDVDFWGTTTGKSASLVTWGCGSVSYGSPDTAVDPWKGALGHSFVHNKYIDLTVGTNRRLFSGLDGIVNLGFQGETPFGERPLIYMPKGHPDDNRGSADTGNWPGDFFFDGTSYAIAGTPPTSGGGPAINLTGSTPWETWFGTPFGSAEIFDHEAVIPDAGISLAFTVPNTTSAYKVGFRSIAVTAVSTTRTGSINQTIGDYTSVPTFTWGSSGGIDGGINLAGTDIDLIPGYTYFFNVKNDTPGSDNRIHLQVYRLLQ